MWSRRRLSSRSSASRRSQAEGHRLLFQVAREPLDRLHLGILNDVRRIEPDPQPRIQPQLDEAQQIRLVP
jgi:hypothetical protein